MEKNCDKHGNVIDGNLTEKQVKTIKDINNKIKEEDLVCFESDKTGNLKLDKRDSYMMKMQKHIANDEVISEKEVRKIETVLNRHSEHLVRTRLPGAVPQPLMLLCIMLL